ncbi:protein kinase domain-containing protein [Lacipirellula limnantheis]|nr:protein kinase [Lacipirellula limnantheis]
MLPTAPDATMVSSGRLSRFSNHAAIAAMTSAATDRNLLFGILAVQMDFVRSEQLIAAMNAWVLDKGRPLGDHLSAIGALPADARQLLDALVDKHIALHGGRADASLAALSSVEPLRQSLADIVDGDVQTSLAHAAALTPRGDRHATVAMPARTPAAPSQRFRILRPHAAGGLGKVSVARDNELNREVALKELHDRHADNLDSRARFLQEAEITGGLEHPGVVPIYGLGQYADGRPFYAMRFIRGDSLAQAIDRFHREADPSWRQPADVLQLRRLLSRFLDVCNAIDYAHSRGVLHRDLKPGNIMLGQYGETLVVDWGLAKPQGEAEPAAATDDPNATLPHQSEPLLRPQSGSGSAPTQMGAAIGTPAFMSPEQAAGRLDVLSGASDVYSLGATLYVILTGRAPQEDDDLGVVLQRVARGEFPKPRSVKPVVPRGLEAICLKAMALQPRDRYPSPRKLADDIEAWLADEPVSALPESIPAQTARWIKNHRTLVTSGVAMALVAIVALAAGNVQLRAANDRERDAKTAALAAQAAAEKALKQAEAAQAESQRQATRNNALLDLARKSLDRYETLSKSELLASYGMESLRSDLLAAAVEFYDSLAAQTDQTEKSRRDRGEALFRLGNANWQLGRMDDARQAYEQAIAQFQQLAREFPDNLAYRHGGAVNAANVAEMLIDNRATTDAERYLSEAATTFDHLRELEPGDAGYAARRAYVASLAGERFRQLGQMEPAVASFNQAIEILQSVDLSRATPEQSVDVRFRLARALNQLAVFELEVLWKFAQAGDHVRQAVQIARTLHEEDRDNIEVAHTLAQILRQSGDIEAREFRLDAARMAYDEGLAVAVALDRSHPDVPHIRQELAELHQSAGVLHGPLEDANLTPAGLEHQEQAVAIGRDLANKFPQQIDRQLALARYEASLADAYRYRGRADDARRLIEDARETLARASAGGGENFDFLFSLANLQLQLANVSRETSELDASLEVLAEARRSIDKLEQLAPNVGEVALMAANQRLAHSMALIDLKRVSDAVAELNQFNAAVQRCGDLAEAPWMKASVASMKALAHTARFVGVNGIRNEGVLQALADEGDYQLCAEQAKAFPLVTGEPSDRVVAAQALAYAAAQAAADEQLGVDDQSRLVDSLSLEAIRQLELAWRQGYLRREKSSGIAGLLFGSAISPDEVREDEQFQALKSRDEFAKLLQRVEKEDPPAESAPSAAPKAGEETSTAQ